MQLCIYSAAVHVVIFVYMHACINVFVTIVSTTLALHIHFVTISVTIIASRRYLCCTVESE